MSTGECLLVASCHWPALWWHRRSPLQRRSSSSTSPLLGRSVLSRRERGPRMTGLRATSGSRPWTDTRNSTGSGAITHRKHWPGS